jgi:putative addiction module component (TIGR02574 family)
MTPRSSELLRQALTLTEEERAELTGSLLESLESSLDPDAESLWQAEVAHRISALDAGEAKTIPWQDVQAQVSAKFQHGHRKG